METADTQKKNRRWNKSFEMKIEQKPNKIKSTFVRVSAYPLPIKFLFFRKGNWRFGLGHVKLLFKAPFSFMAY